MDTARHLEILRIEGERLASVPTDALAAPVPTVEDWNLEQVVRHTGKVHQWVTAVLRLGPGQGMDEIEPTAGIPRGADCVAAYGESLHALLDEFARHDPEQEIPNFSGPGNVAWWARRQANEVQVHRTDAEDAVHGAGGAAPAALTVDGAADGIDEWARFFLAVRWGQRFGELPVDLAGHTVHVHGTDDPAPTENAEWLISFGADGVTVEGTHAKGDVAMRGSTADLFLALWRRRPLSSLDLVGDATVAERMLDVARF